MADNSLSSGLDLLIDSAKSYFRLTFQVSPLQVAKAIDKTVNWAPSLTFKINDHLIVVCEPSENAYPAIFSMRRTDIMRLQVPISIYCICDEEVYLKQQADAKRLINDGYGLLTVDADGNVQRRSTAIPLLQQINDEEFRTEIRSLPQKLRTRLAESFDRYKHNAPSGSADIAEVMEGIILKAGREAADKGWIEASSAKPSAPAATLVAMQGSKQFASILAAVGAAQGYISMYRNLNHHFPKNKKEATKRYRDCKHSFIEGLKQVVFLHEFLRKIKLTGGF